MKIKEQSELVEKCEFDLICGRVAWFKKQVYSWPRVTWGRNPEQAVEETKCSNKNLLRQARTQNEDQRREQSHQLLGKWLVNLIYAPLICSLDEYGLKVKKQKRLKKVEERKLWEGLVKPQWKTITVTKRTSNLIKLKRLNNINNYCFHSSKGYR